MSKGSSSTSRARASLAGVSLNSENRSPLYHQIYLILRNKILDGEYARGSCLPGERELGEIFNVSRITTVRALNELAANGLVVRSRGRGTLVQFVDTGTVIRGPAETPGQRDAAPESGRFPEILGLQDSRAKRVTIHEFEYVVAPPAVEAALKLPHGEIVQFAVRTWSLDDKPFNYVTSYVPQSIGHAWTRTDMAEAPLGDLLERSGVGVTHTHERVAATLADNTLADRLSVGVGSPLLKIIRTSYSANDRPVEYMIGFYPPDRYQYEVTVPRVRAPAKEPAKETAKARDTRRPGAHKGPAPKGQAPKR